MPIVIRKSKKRKPNNTPDAKKRRLEYKKSIKNSAVKKAAQKKAKLFYKKNRGAILRKSKLNSK